MPGMGFGFGFGFHRRASGSGAAHQKIINQASTDGWLMVANADDADTVTLRDDGGNEFQTEIADGLGNVGALSQATAADQPQHVDVTNGGKTFKAGRYDGANTYLTQNSDLHKALPISALMVISPNTISTNNRMLWVADRSSTRYAGWSIDITTGGLIAVQFFDGAPVAGTARRTKIGTTDVQNSLVVISAVWRGATDMDIRINGTDDGGTYSGSGGALAYDGNGGALGAEIDGGKIFDGDIPLAMFYNGDAVGDGKMSGMETLVKDLYGVS